MSVDISASFKSGIDWKIGGGPKDLWLSDGISWVSADGESN